MLNDKGLAKKTLGQVPRQPCC